MDAFQINKDILATTYEDEVILIYPEKGIILSLNNTGSLIFNEFVEKNRLTKNDIITLFKDNYEIPDDNTLAVDIEEILTAFLTNGLINAV